MDANGLRIGSYLKNGKKIIKVDESFFAYLKLNVQFHKPIKITPQILLNCGFYLDGEDSDLGDFYGIKYKYKGGFGEKNILIIDCLGGVQIWSTNEPDEAVNLCKVKYLHELQNLYFLLSGKELKINL